MANLRIFNRNNTVYIAGKAYPSGSVQASLGSGNTIVITRVDNSQVIVNRAPFANLVDKDGTAWGNTASNVVTALNNYINASNPDKVMVADDEASFTGKSGYTVIVDQTNEQITSSGKLLFTASDIKLGDDLNVQNYSIYTSTTNGDVQLTPNGTGSVNLDGTVQFKRFDTSDSANIPAAEEGKMYADEDDNLFFGVSS
jgi:hypothetical protein